MEGKGKENLPLLSHLLFATFSMPVGIPGGACRPRDLDSVNVSQGCQVLVTHRVQGALKLVSVTPCKMLGLNSAAK